MAAVQAARNILIAVDDTKGTKDFFPFCTDACACMRPETVTLVYVEKFEGRSLIDEMLGDAEMATLKEALAGTEYQAMLDSKAGKILSYYRTALEARGLTGVRTMIRKGHPAEEILAAAKETGADLIMIGSRGRRTSHLFMGSVSREVANAAEVPVLLLK